MADSILESARRRIAAMMTKVGSPMSEGQVDSLREELTWLRRDLERHRGEIDAVIASATEVYDELARGTRNPTPTGAPEFRSARPTPANVPDHLGASTFMEKGWNLISAGRFADAEEALRKALELASDEVEALNLLGWAQMYQEKYDDALMTFQAVLLRQPESASARINIGYICLRKRIFGEAIEHLTRVIRGNSDRKSVLYANYYMGLLYLEREMYDDSTAFLRTACTMGPNLIEAFYDLGRSLWFSGEQAGARQAWREGAAANKFNVWGKRCAEMLELVDHGGEPPRGG